MGLEKTFYQVSEDVGVVEVCAIVYSPNANRTCPISFPFDVSLSTRDDSAGITYTAVSLHDDCNSSTVTPMDYLGVSTILMFEECDRRRCVNVTIVDDKVLEMTESFTVTLERTPGLDSRITLDPVDGVVEITDDGEKTFSQAGDCRWGILWRHSFHCITSHPTACYTLHEPNCVLHVQLVYMLMVLVHILCYYVCNYMTMHPQCQHLSLSPPLPPHPLWLVTLLLSPALSLCLLE